jgi:hypothetical protein
VYSCSGRSSSFFYSGRHLLEVRLGLALFGASPAAVTLLQLSVVSVEGFCSFALVMLSA